MSISILYTIISLSLLGAVSALVLFFVAQRFKVYEDPRIDLVEAELSGANCGACGYPGCRNLAENLVKSDTMDGLFCPGGGNEAMARIAVILGKEAVMQDKRVAVLLCNGTYECRPRINNYDGIPSCAIVSALFGSETGCSYGCVGWGDCVTACRFDALQMDPFTGLPVVDDIKCTGCGACVEACPKFLLELRKRWKGEKKIFVACMNEEREPVAKNCTVACIACGKCFTACTFEAIIMKNNLAFIDSDQCRLCRKCVTECPAGSILEVGFPARKFIQETPAVSSHLNLNEK